MKSKLETNNELIKKKNVLKNARKTFKNVKEFTELLEQKDYLYDLAVKTFVKLSKKKTKREMNLISYNEFLESVKESNISCSEKELQAVYLAFIEIRSAEKLSLKGKHNEETRKKLFKAIEECNKELSMLKKFGIN